MKRDLPWRLFLGVLWLLLVFVAFAVFVICIPLLLAVGLYFLFVEISLHIRLLWAGRTLSWAKARAKLQAGGGTLLLEVLPHGGEVERVWLLRDRLAKLDPLAPWNDFAELDRQLRGEPQALTVDDGFTAWCRRTLPRLAPGLCLVSGFPAGTLRRSLDESRLPERSVAVVLAPQLTAAVRRSFGTPRAPKE
ncbi:MAG: hypothetical protein ACJ8F7_03190 [Gemmataceae bacterium]